MTATIVSFVVMQLLLTAVGLAATFGRRSDAADYLMAGRSVHPWLVALAASSTNNSGFMFIGLIGATYTAGLSAMWLMVGWIAGDYLAWLFINRRLRERSEEVGAASVPSFLSAHPQGAMTAVRVAAALITFAFLGSYAAAQLTAGGKAVQAVFGWPPGTGAIISFVLILAYSFQGGLRASIWANSAQALVMMGTIWMLLCASLTRLGGLGALWTKLAALDPALIDWRPRDAKFGVAMFIISWIMAGVGVLGQPHLVTLTMSIRDSASLKQARPVYFAFYVLFSAACILAGLCCRALLDVPGAPAFDQELALPRLSLELLPDALVGVVMAGLFSATMSTADTQILCNSAAVSQDLLPGLGRHVFHARLVTAAVASVVLVIALTGSQSVFELVTLSWSSLAAALGPLLVLQALRQPLSTPVALAVMLSGLGTALYWRYGLQLSDSLYEVLPGMFAGWLVYLILRPLVSPAPATVPQAADGAGE